MNVTQCTKMGCLAHSHSCKCDKYQFHPQPVISGSFGNKVAISTISQDVHVFHMNWKNKDYRNKQSRLIEEFVHRIVGLFHIKIAICQYKKNYEMKLEKKKIMKN